MAGWESRLASARGSDQLDLSQWPGARPRPENDRFGRWSRSSPRAREAQLPAPTCEPDVPCPRHAANGQTGERELSTWVVVIRIRRSFSELGLGSPNLSFILSSAISTLRSRAKRGNFSP